MKKQLENILAQTGKKSGVTVLICAVVLAMSLGTLAGCSATRGSRAGASDLAGISGPSGASGLSGASGPSGASGLSGASGPTAVPGPSGTENRQAESMQSGLPLQGASDAELSAAAFVPGMGCSDPTCTEAAHHHDCPADCADYEHHHACALDCTEAGHHHARTAANHSGNSGNSGSPNDPGNSANPGNSGNSGGRRNDAGHHSDRHHG